jgi:hypothetical protein
VLLPPSPLAGCCSILWSAAALKKKLKCPFNSHGYCFPSSGYPLWAAAASHLAPPSLMSGCYSSSGYLLWLAATSHLTGFFVFCCLGLMRLPVAPISCRWLLSCGWLSSVVICCLHPMRLAVAPHPAPSATLHLTPCFTCHLCLPHTLYQFVCSIPTCLSCRWQSMNELIE